MFNEMIEEKMESIGFGAVNTNGGIKIIKYGAKAVKEQRECRARKNSMLI
jgi:hypothetical protein